MIKDKKVIAGFSNLVIEDVPLPIALPFAFFPITKKGTSGIIMPTYGEERMRGFNLKNGGYYWAISDYIDLSLTGDIYTNGSWGANLITNYRKRYKFSGNLNFSMSRNHTSEKGLPDYNQSKDWSLRWSHSQDAKANPYSTFSASVDISSSNNTTTTPPPSTILPTNASNPVFLGVKNGPKNHSALLRHSATTKTAGIPPFPSLFRT